MMKIKTLAEEIPNHYLLSLLENTPAYTSVGTTKHFPIVIGAFNGL